MPFHLRNSRIPKPTRLPKPAAARNDGLFIGAAAPHSPNLREVPLRHRREAQGKQVDDLGPFVSMLARIVLILKLRSMVKRDLSRLIGKRWREFVRFKHARKPAFRFFCWAAEQRGYAHDSRTYNAMVAVLGKTMQFESMVSVLEEMGEKSLLFKIGVEAINCLLDALGRGGLGKEAQELFEKLEYRFTPDLKTYTILLNGWCRARNLMEAGRIWNGMIDNGFKPDISVVESKWTRDDGRDVEKKRNVNATAVVEMTREMKTKVAAAVFFWSGKKKSGGEKLATPRREPGHV
ncbi:Pentatricopeptide repeat superfamily protein [Perilla frutescens var. hirtella]|nr:Pentatricopeptide repeat superfamily protein [Perilla frutescens var. hirtella]